MEIGRNRAVLHLPAALVVVVGMLVAFGGYRESLALDRAWRETRFVESSDAHAAALQDSMDALEAKLRGVVGLYAASKRVERGELEAYWEAAVATTAGLEWLAWVQQVDAGERAAFEAQAAADSYPGFEIRDARGGARAAEGPVFLPIELVVPLAGHEKLVGRDCRAYPRVLGLLARAQHADALRMLEPDAETAGLILPGEILVALTAWSQRGARDRTAVRGYLVAAVNVRRLAAEGLARLTEHDDTVAVTVSLAAADDAMRQIYPAGSAPAAHPGLAPVQRTLRFAGGRWVFTCEPLATAAVWQGGAWPLWIGAGLLLLFVLIAAFVNQTLARTGQVERLVALRSGQLAESQRHNTAILANVVDAIVTTDADGNILSANRATGRLFGYEPAELEGMNVERLLPTPFDAGRSATGSGLRLEMDGRRKDGSTFPVELAVGDIETEAGTLFAGVVRDLSESRRVAQMKDEFVSIVSHELRTPLTSILGSLGLIRGGVAGELSDKLRSMIELAHSNGERLVRLINDILDMEKLAAGKMVLDRQVLSVSALVDEAVGANQGYAEQYNARLIGEVPEPGARVVADRDRLLQVLANLISNACKYSPAGGAVRVTATPVGNRLRVEVHDEGAGIPLDQQAAVFEKFTQADATDQRAKAGTGLGLSIVRAIIEQHGGRVGVRSEPSEGTTFWFELPMLSAVRTGPAEAPCVLVCEDDPDTGRVIQEILEGAGLASTVAPDAAAALAATAGGGFAAMTLDLELPDQGGLAMLRELRSTPGGKTLPVVIVSGADPAERDRAEALTLGLTGWLGKPIDASALVASIQKGLEAAGASSALPG